jgi:hypothetical protein
LLQDSLPRVHPGAHWVDTHADDHIARRFPIEADTPFDRSVARLRRGMECCGNQQS